MNSRNTLTSLVILFLFSLNQINAQCAESFKSFNDNDFLIGEEIKIPGLYVSNPIQSFTEIGNSLEHAVSFLKEHPELTVEISAFTDFRGKDDYNLRISEKYIDLISKWIRARHGNLSEKISYKAYGELSPIFNDDYIDTVEESERNGLHKCNNRVSMKVKAVDSSKKLPKKVEESEMKELDGNEKTSANSDEALAQNITN